ncbi:MAG: GNAT family N-acetyltransferase [Acidimicrobiales bacterium]
MPLITGAKLSIDPSVGRCGSGPRRLHRRPDPSPRRRGGHRLDWTFVQVAFKVAGSAYPAACRPRPIRRHRHVLVEEDGTIVGRVNLTVVGDGSAELGYRIAERAAGRGLAAAAVRQV